MKMMAIRRNLTEEKMDETVPAVLTEFAKSDEHPRNSEGDVIRLRDGRLPPGDGRFVRRLQQLGARTVETT